MAKQAQMDMSGHVAVFGETQSGKTTLVSHIQDRFTDDHGVLVIDLEDLDEFDADLRADKTTSTQEIYDTLASGGTVVYTVDAWDKDTRKNEVKNLGKLLIFEWNIPVYVIGDEIQEYGNSGSNAFDVYAVRGLKRGVHLVAITQRPAKLSNTIATQTTTFVFFEVGEFERRYFEKYNLPFERIQHNFSQVSGDYWFQVYARGQGLSQPLKIRNP